MWKSLMLAAVAAYTRTPQVALPMLPCSPASVQDGASVNSSHVPPPCLHAGSTCNYYADRLGTCATWTVEIAQAAACQAHALRPLTPPSCTAACAALQSSCYLAG
jgi:hypothetical protein